jgi:uncharacterized protein (DUF488 family)
LSKSPIDSSAIPTAAIWTVGHSSRAIDVFLTLLRANDIQRVADVRRYAGSRAHPQFNPEPLAHALGQVQIDYVAFPELGGRRQARPDSKNTIWQNAAFRGYADYMETHEFGAGLERLRLAAVERRTAILCAEAVWWSCHRSMIADALKAEGMRVLHIMEGGKVTEHPYTSAARIVDGKLEYGAGLL